MAQEIFATRGPLGLGILPWSVVIHLEEDLEVTLTVGKKYAILSLEFFRPRIHLSPQRSTELQYLQTDG